MPKTNPFADRAFSAYQQTQIKHGMTVLGVNLPSNNISVQMVQTLLNRNYLIDLPGNANNVQLHCPEAILNEFKSILSDSSESGLLGCKFENPYTGEIETIPEDASELTARHLQILARNESVNTTGHMKTELYNSELTAVNIAKIRCLVKATVISGVTMASHWGGYGYGNQKTAFDKPEKVIIIDQAGLQWQNDFRNTGGMFFYPDSSSSDNLPAGFSEWQTPMFKAMYGIERPKTPSENTINVTWSASKANNSVLVSGRIDLDQVKNAIDVEFSQALEAAIVQGNLELDENEKINFKFLKAGMGFFSSGITSGDRPSLEQLEIARLQGIEQALRRLNNLPKEQRAKMFGRVARIELPFSSSEHERPYVKNIQTLVESLGLTWGGAPNEDCLKPREGYVNALTNCADPHAAIGNEGGYSSVDAAISSNVVVDHLIAAANLNIQCRASTRFLPYNSGASTASSVLNLSRNASSASSSSSASTTSKTYTLIEYIQETCKAHAISRGKWVLVNRNAYIEVGMGNMTGNLAIASKEYHIEIQGNTLVIFDKINKGSSGQFTKITDSARCENIIQQFEGNIAGVQFQPAAKKEENACLVKTGL